MAQAAAAAALRYQQLLSQVNAQGSANPAIYNSPHKPYNYANNGYEYKAEPRGDDAYEHDENEETENNYSEPNGEDKAAQGMMGTARDG